MTTLLSCPSCGAPVPFQSRTSVSATCPYCRSVLVRQDLKLEEIGKVATLMDDVTPLQLGSQGKYKGQSFILLGRARWKWEDGFWNEWHMAFGGGASGWLGEAQGQLAVSREVPGPKLAASGWKPGKLVKIGNVEYEVADVKSALCLGTEGEMPVVVKPGTIKTAVDCGNDKGGYACIEVEGALTRAYAGTAEDFDSLALSNLRTIDGW